MITIKTKIGYGSPKEGMASAHGEPLGEDNIRALKEKLGWPSQEPFFVPEEVYDNYKAIAQEKAKDEEAWNSLFEQYCTKYPEMKELWNKYHDENVAKDLIDNDDFWAFEDKADATRNISVRRLSLKTICLI